MTTEKPPFRFNTIATYADCGRRCRKAQDHRDQGLVDHHRSWLRRALALEPKDYQAEARAAFDEAYRNS